MNQRSAAVPDDSCRARTTTTSAIAVACAAALLSCGGGGGSGNDEQPEPRAFVFQSSAWPDGERFIVRLTDPVLIAQTRAELQLPLAERRRFPNGRLQAGNGNHNDNWNWHLVDVEFTMASIELCDGRPSMVEANLDYWLHRVGRYCPWSARVVAALD